MSEHNTDKGDARVERARAEIRAQAATLRERPLLERAASPASQPSGSRVDPARLAYRIGELTDAHHQAFVDQAFQALLKRAPSPAESDAQLALLAAGATKAEVLGNLRWSPEGRAVGARVAGLAPRYAMAKLRRVPLLGYLVDIPLNLAALPALARHQRASDAMVAAGTAQAARNLAAQAEATSRDLALARQRLDDLHAFAHELNVARDDLARQFNEVDSQLRSRIHALEDANGAVAGRFDEFEFIRQRFYAINHWMHHLTESFARIEGAATQGDHERRREAWPVAQACIEADAARSARNAVWADALRALSTPGALLFTGACGADWVASIAAQDLRVVFADADAPLAAIERTDRIDVEAVDTFEGLRRSADAGLDGAAFLAMSNLLRARPLLDWLRETRRALKPGAPLLLADAREPGAIVDVLTKSQPRAAADLPSWTPSLFAAAGFADAQRIDAADGTPAWLMQRGAA